MTTAVVVSQDPDRYGLNVTLQGFGGGQMPALPVAVLTHGPRDAIRGTWPELALPGTLGLVAFPRGDLRNGVWLGALSPALNDSSPHVPGSANVAFASHYGGGASWRGQDGTTFEEWPDGTTMQVGPTVPALTRHTVGSGQERLTSPFGLAERVSLVPQAFQWLLNQSTGASGTVTSGGTWLLAAAPGQSVVLSANGAGVKVLPDGSILLYPAAGKPVTVSGELRVTGPVTAGYGTSGSIGVTTHTHPDPQGGNVGAPNPGT